MNLAGAVLCGGASRRMGRDKALIEIDGVALAERVARALEAAGCHPVVFVGGDAAALASTRRRYVRDRWPGQGPVGGVVSALSALAGDDTQPDAVVVCACDLVDLTAEAVRSVAGDGSMSADVRVADSGRVEPLLACWNPAAAMRVVAQFEAGVRAMHQVLAGLRVDHVSVDPAVVRNVNRPGDLGVER